MRFILILICFLFVTSASYAQRDYVWVPTKTTKCKSHSIPTTIEAGGETVKLNSGYVWTKEKCTTQEYNDQKRRPRIKGGYHIAPNGKRYFFDRRHKIAYQVYEKSCSSKVYSEREFWILMQK